MLCCLAHFQENHAHSLPSWVARLDFKAFLYRVLSVFSRIVLCISQKKSHRISFLMLRCGARKD